MPTADVHAGQRLPFDPEPIGRWLDGPPVTMPAGLLAAYTDAVDAGPGGAAPLVSIVACYPILFTAVELTTPEPVRPLTVHGEHDVTLHRPVRAGAWLTARARPVSVTAARSGARVHVELEVRDDSARLVATHRLTAICRGVVPLEQLGEPPEPWPEQQPPIPFTDRTTVPVALDQPGRYAEATGDVNAVHLDDAAARAVGFPGVIAHGLGVLGLVTSALVRTECGGDAERLERLRVRFSAPVRPGDTLTMAHGRDGDSVAFEVTDPVGSAVLRGGRALVTR